MNNETLTFLIIGLVIVNVLFTINVFGTKKVFETTTRIIEKLTLKIINLENKIENLTSIIVKLENRVKELEDDRIKKDIK